MSPQDQNQPNQVPPGEYQPQRPPPGWKPPKPPRKRFYQRAWFIVVASIVGLIVLASIIPSNGDSNSASTSSDPTTAPATQPQASTKPSPKPSAKAPTTKAPAPAATAVKVTQVVDGDTVKVSSGQTVRLIGIDTPERGQCGSADATGSLELFVNGKAVTLIAVAGRDDKDRYGRLLRYVSVDGRDAGLMQLRLGLAHARYDGRDGYGTHPRQDEYVGADAASPVTLCERKSSPKPTVAPTQEETTEDLFFANCSEARASGVPLPLTPGDPGWNSRLDRDKDGKACE